MKNKSVPLSKFDVPENVLKILANEGIIKTYPPQTEAISLALSGENLVVAIPTASGKSLIAYLAILKSILNGGKALYIVPLRALATEKFEDLKRFEELGIKVELSMGNLDSQEPRLSDFDVIIATSEKTDSLLRHRASWLKNISIIISDEIHLINDPSRGPTLELILARFKQVNPQAQIIALSATIQNSIDLAGWLGAQHIQSTWRPVKLVEGVYFDGNINFLDNTKKEIHKVTDEVTSLVLDTVKNSGQILVFVNSRRSTEALAKRLEKPIAKLLSKEDMDLLSKTTKGFKTGEVESTTIADRLLSLISSGVAFHHAGLADTQRKLVERNFKAGLIKCIIATPTLAAGINLPARRVVVRDVTRYDIEIGFNAPIPVLEVKQMMGRAGRPKYDTIGEAILIAKSSDMVSELKDRYILRDTEPIYSKLSIERALRTHILAAIASEFVKNSQELEKYIGNSFYAHQSEYYKLTEQIEKVLTFLEINELIKADPELERFGATEFGRRTSSLYLDPETAVFLKHALKNAEGSNLSPLIYLHAICSTPDMLTFYLRKKDYEWVEGVVSENENRFIHIWYETGVGYDDFLSSVKTACMLEDWIEERSEEHITNKYNIGPGDIRNKVETGRWLSYSFHELAKLFNKEQQRPLSNLISRITYGVSEELLDLVALSGIGRVRARSLFKHGYKSKKDLKAVDKAKLARIPSIGPVLADKIKAQV